MQNKLLSTSDVARLLGVTSRTVLNWIDEGKIPAFRFGLSYKIAENDLKNFVENSKIRKEEKENE